MPTGAPGSGGRRAFPDPVIEALHHAGLTVTCLPVEFEHGVWQSAFFFVVAPEAPSYRDGQLAPGPFGVSLEADLHERPEATVVELGIEIGTPEAPLAGAVLLLTGHSSLHFETLKLLCEQTDIPLFIGDPFCRVLWQQRIPIDDSTRGAFRELLDESVARDAMIRLTARYDPDAAFAAVLKSRGFT